MEKSCVFVVAGGNFSLLDVCLTCCRVLKYGHPLVSDLISDSQLIFLSKNGHEFDVFYSLVKDLHDRTED